MTAPRTGPPPPSVHRRGIGDDPVARALLPVGRSGWAIAAGYLGLIGWLLLLGVPAVIVSLIAIADLKNHPEKHGMGRAVFGLVSGLIGVLGYLALQVLR